MKHYKLVEFLSNLNVKAPLLMAFWRRFWSKGGSSICRG